MIVRTAKSTERDRVTTSHPTELTPRPGEVTGSRQIAKGLPDLSYPAPTGGFMGSGVSINAVNESPFSTYVLTSVQMYVYSYDVSLM
ncbi:hypothetical protein AVEN_106095-1 [Araneus ventricosus]|uniref:Uncharacterized protein n=1 Tax=Araneus ventricosus TaxID=182803 RepID=A0A4Y2HT62_ARAVE|nr:hypothetical protein AVEN_106095-1 [Araneus ventricosus]